TLALVEFSVAHPAVECYWRANYRLGHIRNARHAEFGADFSLQTDSTRRSACGRWPRRIGGVVDGDLYGRAAWHWRGLTMEVGTTFVVTTRRCPSYQMPPNSPAQPRRPR